jgi:hypothetical protein
MCFYLARKASGDSRVFDQGERPGTGRPINNEKICFHYIKPLDRGAAAPPRLGTGRREKIGYQ